MTETLSIRTMHEQDVCDVCARTLLRGEHTETFVSGGRRYNVCELCKPRALHEGWMREGAIPEYQAGTERPARRRSLFGRRRERQAAAPKPAREQQPPAPPRTLDDELSFSESHVHAIPTSGDHQVANAVDVFNASTHRRTVLGVARSLGAPVVNLTPDQQHPGIVWVTVSWDLCWYRYEVDLSSQRGSVRLDSQGYELSELGERERTPNAACDETGALVFV